MWFSTKSPTTLTPVTVERPDGGTKHVEVTREAGIGDVMDARIERDCTFTLGANGCLDSLEHLAIGEADRPHVVV